MRILITGAAGFIGSALTNKLLLNFGDIDVFGIDNMNDYYEVSLKEHRCSKNIKFERFHFMNLDISDKKSVFELFEKNHFDIVINLAAQAGVRYSIENPDVYIASNIIGFYNILEACRHHPVKHLIFASSSSVYGSNKKVPFSTEDKVDNPVSLYASTKKCDELLAHCYSKLYAIPCTGLRFFTVYGPMGRPDMAYFKFTNKAVKGESIQIYNNGDMYRDFTYIDDIVEGIINVMGHVPLKNEDGVAYKIYNIGNNKPVTLKYFVDTLESVLLDERIINKPFKREYKPMQPGDVYQTYADVDDLLKDFNWKPSTSLKEGLTKFAMWYKSYYNK